MKSRPPGLGEPSVEFVVGAQGEALVFSMRRVSDLVAYCMNYEFEDTMVAAAGADRVDLVRRETVEFERRVYKALHALTRSPRLALKLTPSLGARPPARKYELFVAVFNSPYEVFALRAIAPWRDRCRRAVCLITEAWEDDMPPYLLKSLGDFDRIYVSSNVVESMARHTGRPCSYLPFSVDAIAMSPLPGRPTRSIDVLGIGRRSAITHDALIRAARERGLFYYYDTTRTTAVANAAQQVTFSVMNAAEHRLKLASLLKRSRYYLASRARANEVELADKLDDISGRFFEGAAAGAIMLGDPPRSGPYLSLFDWPDAVVKMPFDQPEIVSVIEQLDADPARCIRIRRENMINALLRHDGVYRLRTILEDAALPIPEGVLTRERRLRELADAVRTEPIAP